MKKLLVSMLMIGSLLLVGCASHDSSSNVDTVNSTEASVQVDTLSAEQIKAGEQKMLEIYENDFGGNFEVSFNEENKAFYLLPTNRLLINEINQVINGQRDVEEWATMIRSICNYSQGMEDGGLSGYSVELLNPYNNSRTLVLIMDGKLLSDSVADSVGYQY